MADQRSEPTLGGRDLIGLGGLLVGAVVLGLVVGLLLDHLTGDSPTFVLLGIVLGILAGIAGFVVRVRTVLRATSGSSASSGPFESSEGDAP